MKKVLEKTPMMETRFLCSTLAPFMVNEVTLFTGNANVFNI